MRKEMRTPKASFTHQELLSFTEKILDEVCIDCCPNCEVLLNWRDCHDEDDIKAKIEEIGTTWRWV